MNNGKMVTFMVSFLKMVFAMVVLFSSSCSVANTRIDLVGSTPGDDAIKAMLSISADTKVDFIRWDLKLDSKNAFVLNITYGESQPNTLGFKGGGEEETINGSYLIAKNQHGRFKEIYELKSDDLAGTISLVRITENIFHILTSQRQLMVGNGGWSFSLNRKAPVDTEKILISSSVSDDRSLRLVFDGRTPCQEFAAENAEVNASPSCFKLKWRVTLNRDSVTYLPTTCTVRSIVDNQPRDISGKWQIIKGTATNPDAVIYKIMVDDLMDPILLLASDENVLFFLDKNSTPFTGNADFSFALNRKI